MKKRNLLKMMILGAVFGMTVISNGAAKKGNQDCYIPKEYKKNNFIKLPRNILRKGVLVTNTWDL